MVKNGLGDNMSTLNATRCECGAITVEINGASYSMPRKIFLDKFPGEKVPRKTMGCCDYCVNKWGVDLCGCGSGKKFKKCKEGYAECRRPAQSIEEEIACCTTDGGGWG
jgi:hypothetical protein